jgi:uncharacterized protein (DUF427 family)
MTAMQKPAQSKGISFCIIHLPFLRSGFCKTLMKATWNNATLAESDDTVVVEGNHYFPRGAINTEFFQPSETHTVCPWKGTASYYDIVVDGETNPDAAWYYPEPKPAAQEITDRIAFWKGVEVTD